MLLLARKGFDQTNLTYLLSDCFIVHLHFEPTKNNMNKTTTNHIQTTISKRLVKGAFKDTNDSDDGSDHANDPRSSSWEATVQPLYTTSPRRTQPMILEKNHQAPDDKADHGGRQRLDRFFQRASLLANNNQDYSNNYNNNDSGEMALVDGQSPRQTPSPTRSSSRPRFSRPELIRRSTHRSSIHAGDRASHLRRVIRKTNVKENGEESLIVVNGLIQDTCARHTIVF